MSETLDNAELHGIVDTSTQADDPPAIDPDTNATASETGEEANTEQQPDSANKDTEEAPKQRPWFEKVIARKDFEAREATRRATALEAEISRYRQGQAPQEAPPPGYVPVADVERMVEQHAATSRLNADCDAVADYGAEKFPDFGEAQRNLQMMGGITPTFLEVVTGLGKEDGARVFRELGLNPDRAERILQMSPARMGVELARMAAAPAPKPAVSKAPPPITPIGSGTTRSTNLDTMGDADFRREFARRYQR